MTSQRRAALAVSACAVLLVAVGGCGGSQDEGQSTASSFAADLVEEARAGGADEWQICILQQDEISFTDYETAINKSLDCMREAGIDVLGPETVNVMGLDKLRYSWSPDLPGLTQEQGTALGNDCLDRFGYWIDRTYQTQPAAMEAQEQYFEPFRSLVVACVNENGGQAEEDGTRGETIRAAWAVQEETGIDCLTLSGLDTFGGT